MLLIKTYLAVSPIHGIGLYATEPVAKGTVIWRYDERVDRRYTKKERQDIPDLARSFLATYSYPEGIGSDVYIVDGDHARFMNHSDSPNTDARVDTIATRDIFAGEELVCDYRQF